MLTLTLAGGIALSRNSNSHIARASASEGVSYGFVDFKRNAGVQSAYPSAWTLNTAGSTFTQDSQTNLEWKVSSGFRGSDNSFYLGGYLDGKTASEVEARGLLNLSASDDDFAGMVSATGQSSGYGFAIQSSDYIEGINDLHFSLSSEAGFLYVMYHLPTDADGEWNIIKTIDGENTFAPSGDLEVGSHGVYSGGYDSFNWSFKFILADNEDGSPRAMIAFVYWTFNYTLNAKLNLISVNTDKATKGYLDKMSEDAWCSKSGTYKTTLEILNNHLSTAQNTTLSNIAITDPTFSAATHCDNYYQFFEYVCNQYSISISNPLSSNAIFVIVDTNANKFLIITIISLVAISSISVMFIRRKKMAK